MNEQLVSKKTSTLAKEKGFNEETYDYFNQNGECETSLEKEYFNKGIHTSENIITISCPTQSLLQKWLREKHNINVLVQESNISDLYKCMIGKKDRRKDISTDTLYTSDYKTYEDAIEKGLYFALKMI